MIVLGGGLAGLAAAYELSRTPTRRDALEVHLYQIGWRLGGKCATGRDIDDAKLRGRVEEHGLHVIGGYYENLLRIMRGSIPSGNLDDELVPIRDFTFRLEICGRMYSYHQVFTDGIIDNQTEPGHRDHNSTWPTPLELEERLLSLLKLVVNQLMGVSDILVDSTPSVPRVLWRYLSFPNVGAVEPQNETLQEFDSWSRRSGPLGEVRDLPAWKAALAITIASEIRWAITLSHQTSDSGELKELIATLKRNVVRRIGRVLQIARYEQDLKTSGCEHPFPQSVVDNEAAILLAGLGNAVATILVNYPVDTDGFKVLDRFDFVELLRYVGALPEVVASPFVKAAYEYPFTGLSEGDGTDRLAAGVALRFLGRMMLDFIGAPQRHPKRGMGDSVIKRIYQQLVNQKVIFHFFHNIDLLELDQSRKSVQTIQFYDQIPQLGAFDPLVQGSHTFPTWPNRPHLSPGKPVPKADLENTTTSVGSKDSSSDFAAVVLALPVSEMPRVARDIMKVQNGQPVDNLAELWIEAVTSLPTVPTLGAQIWLDPLPHVVYGGTGCPLQLEHLGADWLSAWADATHVLPFEYPGPNSLVYFVGRAPKGWNSAAQVRAQVESFVKQTARFYWPGLVTNGKLDPDKLYTYASTNDPFGEQYYRLNGAIPGKEWERYALSPPLTPNKRIHPEDSKVKNLFPAGDWTHSGLDVGCAEGATMSGLMAARGVLRLLMSQAEAQSVFIYGEADFKP